VILYSQLLFGNLFAIRTLHIFHSRALLSVKMLTKIGTAFVCASALTSFYAAQNAFLCSCLIVSGLFILIISLFVCERRQIDALKSEVPLFLDRWILNLRLGLALPTAREAALHEQSEGFQILMRPLFATRSVPGQKRRHLLFAAAALQELESLHGEAHSALARLENLRALLRKTSEFRRKSGQATRQSYIQATVMLLLLIALTLFTLYRYGWKQASDLITGAILLSAMGLVTMHFMARKTKWKI
jgi:hypothetical protein